MQNTYQVNGVLPHPQANGHRPPASSSGYTGWMRTPTVSEALPYTPFSSIVPFNPEVIPAPIATPPPNVNYGLEDHQASRRVLDRLSAQATSAENASRRCQQTLSDVQKLLDPEGTTDFKFKKPKNLAPADTARRQTSFKVPVLSLFAKMVLDSNDISFRYLTPESPQLQTARNVNGRSKTVHCGLVTPSSEISDVKPAHLQKNKAQSSQDVLPGHSSQTLQAVVVDTLAPAQRAEHQYVADNSMKTNKRQSLATPSTRTISIDQRQKGDAAVGELQSLLNDIFEAEDQFHPDTEGASISTSLQLLSLADSDEGPVAVLQPAAQEKLDAAVQSVAKYGRIDGIEIEQLVRVQKLGERGVSSAASSFLYIGEDWSDEDAQHWQQKLSQAESGLLAARTLLRIMTAGRQEKELQSEDIVQNILELLKSVIETGLVPVIEERSYLGEKGRGADKSQQNPKFVIASRYRDSLKAVLQSVTKTFRLLAGLLSRVDVDESAISSVVFMCKSLIFAENATNDKDSVMGIQPIESTRKHAMDVLARIFTRYNDQRQFVIDEILVSLEKLPGTKQSARQFRLPDAKPIQLVSALLMRLVQTSATRGTANRHAHGKANGHHDDPEDSDADMADEDSDSDEDDKRSEASPSKGLASSKSLMALVKPLHDSAASDASYIVRILINRASTTAKNADEPYRKLLDIFTEDFLNVLASSDWPAAELLLRTMLTHMINLVENPKSTVPSRNLALELIGTMGSGILQLQLQARSAARGIDTTESEVASNLVGIFEQFESGDVDSSTIYGFEGPYRVVLECLQTRDNGADASLQAARGFHLVQWAHNVSSGRHTSVDSHSSGTPGTSKDIQSKLRGMILDPQWLEEQCDFASVSTAAGRLAASLVVLNKTFCKAFPRLFGVLLTAMTDEHSTVKSRSLKSVVAVLEKDPSVLDRNRNILKNIFRCAEDNSPLVRESALGLVAKCVALRPELDKAVFEQVILRTHDPAVGVRKRALKMLKDIYLRHEVSQTRSAIANAIISRIQDAEESITELARVTMEEIWFAPFHGLNMQGENGVQAKLQYRAQAALLIQTVDLGESVLRVLESLLREVLSKSKLAPANSRVCKTLVDVLFDGIVDPADIPGTPPQEMILQTLTVFAKACPTLIDSAQLERLAPYTRNLTTDDDLAVFRSVLVILRQTMPYVKTFKSDFLKTIQSSLMASIPKLPKSELPEVASCLWTIDGELKNTDRLINLIISALLGVRNAAKQDLAANPLHFKKVNKLMTIVGQFGKACNFEDDLENFKMKLNMPKAASVSGLAIDILCTFTSPKQPLAVRESSMEAICAICQRWPKQFLRVDVMNAFELALKEHVSTLEHIFVSGLEGFFATQDTPADGQGGAAENVVTGRERLAKTYVATDQDGASSALAQRFLQDILRLALSSHDDLALTSTKLIASILQQGLPHPKECGPSLVALETSPNATIARIAFNEHRAMHQKHETTIEKEYVRSVQQSFAYQQEVAGSLTGSVGIPPAAKLHFFWEVLKSGKVKVRQKFIGNICQRLEFDPAELDLTAGTPGHLAFTRYCCENLAFFDYDRIDDVLLLLAALEKVFSGVGTAVAQSIESDIQMLHVAAAVTIQPITDSLPAAMGAEPKVDSIEPSRLQTLAASSQVLLLIWETRTFLNRVWNMQKLARKGKAVAKDNSKAPSRATNAPALTDNYLRRNAALASTAADPEQQRAICEQFVEVISIDTEAKVPSEDEEGAEAEEGDEGSETPSRKSPSTTPAIAGKGKKRKSLGSTQGTPRKKRPEVAKRSSGGKVNGEEADGKWV